MALVVFYASLTPTALIHSRIAAGSQGNSYCPRRHWDVTTMTKDSCLLPYTILVGEKRTEQALTTDWVSVRILRRGAAVRRR